MRRLLIGAANISVAPPRRTGHGDHVSLPSPLVGEGRVGGREVVRERRRMGMTSRPPPLPLSTRGRGNCEPSDNGFHLQVLHLILPLARRGGAPFEEAFQMFRMFALACALALSAGSALAQAPAAPTAASPPYGPPITLDQAKRAMAAAELEAAKNSWQVAITILDSGGNMIMFHRVDNAQLSATTVSEGKARTALEFKRPSKALDDAIAAGGAGMRLSGAQGHHAARRRRPGRSSTARSSAPSACPARCRRRTPKSPRPAPTR